MKFISQFVRITIANDNTVQNIVCSQACWYFMWWLWAAREQTEFANWML